MNDTELKKRMKHFALRTIRMVESLPRSVGADVLGRQALRSACSVAANYRSACRAKSGADFVSKMGTVEEEADESGLWFELLGESGIIAPKKVAALLKEADELSAIAVASIRTARSRTRTAGKKSAIRNPKSAIDGSAIKGSATLKLQST
jgi:four helix bundle protein